MLRENTFRFGKMAKRKAYPHTQLVSINSKAEHCLIEKVCHSPGIEYIRNVPKNTKLFAFWAIQSKGIMKDISI